MEYVGKTALSSTCRLARAPVTTSDRPAAVVSRLGVEANRSDRRLMRAICLTEISYPRMAASRMNLVKQARRGRSQLGSGTTSAATDSAMTFESLGTALTS